MILYIQDNMKGVSNGKDKGNNYNWSRYIRVTGQGGQWKRITEKHFFKLIPQGNFRGKEK